MLSRWLTSMLDLLILEGYRKRYSSVEDAAKAG